MLLSVHHTTRFRYAAAARYSIQSLRLTPPSFKGQRVVRWAIEAPGMEQAVEFIDSFGNVTHLVSAEGPSTEIVVRAEGIVETTDYAGIVEGLPGCAPRRLYLRETPTTRPNDAIRTLAARIEATDTLQRMHELLHRVRDAIDYVPGITSAQTTAAEALAAGKGVCQDYAHVFIAAARVLQAPARYVNGYLLDGADAAAPAHHAWAEVWVEDLGWVGFDPANRICPTERYVRLACGLDAASAAPVRGSRIGGNTEALDVVVRVEQQKAQQQC